MPGWRQAGAPARRGRPVPRSRTWKERQAFVVGGWAPTRHQKLYGSEPECRQPALHRDLEAPALRVHRDAVGQELRLGLAAAVDRAVELVDDLRAIRGPRGSAIADNGNKEGNDPQMTELIHRDAACSRSHQDQPRSALRSC